jgi:tetrapyrrole methylase family protein / MazG family protein
MGRARRDAGASRGLVPRKRGDPRRPDFGDLVATMARLRAPDGCPWDRAQTHDSLRPYLLEEVYETLDAIDGGAPDRLKEELGDLLLQVVFHAQMAAEAGTFTIEDVVAGLVEKLVRRHPHVFGSATAATPDAVVTRWEAIKQAERADAGAAAESGGGALAGLTRTLPALMLAQQMQVRTGRAGFRRLSDETDIRGAAGELERSGTGGGAGSRSSRAIGDLLFAVAAAAESRHVDAELALREASERFRARFARLEALARARGTALADCSAADLEVLWREAGEASGETR